MKSFLTYDDLEREFAIKRSTAASYVSRGLIPHIKLGPRNTVFDREEIEKWIDDRRIAVEGGIDAG